MLLKHLLDDVLPCKQGKPVRYRTEAPSHATLAQLVERIPEEDSVPSSNLGGGTNHHNVGEVNMENIYQEHGYENRRDYLESLSDEYNVPLDDVKALADMLGESEDFDGLVSSLEDYTW